jgi:hypothetical protein
MRAALLLLLLLLLLCSTVREPAKRDKSVQLCARSEVRHTPNVLMLQ